jgi:hypothetical protein
MPKYSTKYLDALNTGVDQGTKDNLNNTSSTQDTPT